MKNWIGCWVVAFGSLVLIGVIRNWQINTAAQVSNRWLNSTASSMYVGKNPVSR